MFSNWMRNNIKQAKETTVQETHDIIAFEKVDATQLDVIKNTVDMVYAKLMEIDLRLETLETNQRHIKNMYDAMTTRDQRELNYSIRGFAKHKTAVPFVQQKNSLP